MGEAHDQVPSPVVLTGPWRKSTFSDQNACVELAPTADGVAVRDSKNPSGSMLLFTQTEWAAFLAGARAGEFDIHH